MLVRASFFIQLLISIFTQGLQDDCGTSGWPKHGNVSQISDSIAKYTCEEGHVIVGNNTRLCTEGKWSGYVPLCKPNLAWSGEATQSHVLWSYGPDLARDGRPETCSYTVTRPGPGARAGRWWRLRMTEDSSVGRLEVTLSTPATGVTAYIAEAGVKRPCHPFQPLPGPEAGGGDRQRLYTDCTGLRGGEVIIEDGRDTEDYFGVCEVEIFRYQEILSCGHPDTPTGASVSVSSYIAHYTCLPGHVQSGPRMSRCTQQGWDGSHVPTCRAVTCPPPAPSSNGFIHVSPYTGVYTPGTVALYKCTAGHVIWGQERRVCSDEGTWSGHVPQCRKLASVCPKPPEMENTDLVRGEGEDGRKVATYTCTQNTKNVTIQAMSECGPSGVWSPVHLQCPPPPPSFQFGQDTGKDFMIILICCILFGIISLTVAVTSRLLFKRIQSERGGIFLRSQHFNCSMPGQNSNQHQPDYKEQIFEPPKQEETKFGSKANSKKVSLILKIENDEATNVVDKKSCDSKSLGQFAIQNSVTKSDPRPRLPRARAVELEMMSTSTSSLPLPETSLTLHHCHALSRDSVQFATLSRGRSRRRNDESDASVRLSRSFSSFHPVVPSVPTIKANDRLV